MLNNLKSYIVHKFNSTFVVATISMLVEYLVFLAGTLISGNMLGENALTAITLATPLFTVMIFFSFMISIGTDINSSYESGKGNREEANRYISQGLIVSSLTAILLTLCYLIFIDKYCSIYDLDSITLGYLKEYLFYLCFLPLPLMLTSILYDYIIHEGEQKYCVFSSII